MAEHPLKTHFGLRPLHIVWSGLPILCRQRLLLSAAAAGSSRRARRHHPPARRGRARDKVPLCPPPLAPLLPSHLLLAEAQCAGARAVAAAAQAVREVLRASRHGRGHEGKEGSASLSAAPAAGTPSAPPRAARQRIAHYPVPHAGHSADSPRPEGHPPAATLAWRPALPPPRRRCPRRPAAQARASTRGAGRMEHAAKTLSQSKYFRTCARTPRSSRSQSARPRTPSPTRWQRAPRLAAWPRCPQSTPASPTPATGGTRTEGQHVGAC